jgi:hypothetical protein
LLGGVELKATFCLSPRYTRPWDWGRDKGDEWPPGAYVP